MKFRKLYANEIDVRIGSCKANGVSLLLYKDARCDMNILDETVGSMNWKREHKRDNANCVVSIWDDVKQQWISKEDTGTESNTEQEKGLASDSFKRACVNWGIGRELYTSPFIWFSDKDCKITGGKCYDKFFVKSIDYQPNGDVLKCVIVDKTTKIEKTFSNSLVVNDTEDTPHYTGATVNKSQTEQVASAFDGGVETVEDRQQIYDEFIFLGYDLKAIATAYKKQSIDDVELDKLKKALALKKQNK